MVWSLVLLGAIGLLLGFTFRVGALIAATLLTAVGFLAAEAASGSIGWQTLLPTLGLILLLQCTYLVGLLFRGLWRRIASQ